MMMMSQADEIIQGLEKMVRGRRDLEFLNLYRGVPVLYSASPRSLSQGKLTVMAPAYEAYCLEVEGHTFILCDLLDEAVIARVAAFDLASGRAELGQFAYAGRKIGSRMVIRVEPRDPIVAQIESGGQALVGTIVDVSVDGVAILVSGAGSDRLLKLRTTLQVTFQLPDARIDLAGVVRHYKKRPEGNVLGVGFVQHAGAQAPILEYVGRRRMEIVAELKAAYDEQLAQVKGS